MCGGGGGGVCAIDATGGDIKAATGATSGTTPLLYQVVAFFKDKSWSSPSSFLLGCILTKARTSDSLTPLLNMLLSVLPQFNKFVIDDSGCIRTSLIACKHMDMLPSPVDKNEKEQSRYKRMLLMKLVGSSTEGQPRSHDTSESPTTSSESSTTSYIQMDLRHFLTHLLSDAVLGHYKNESVIGLLQTSINFLQDNVDNFCMCKKVLLLMKKAMSSQHVDSVVSAAIKLLRGTGDGIMVRNLSMLSMTYLLLLYIYNTHYY